MQRAKREILLYFALFILLALAMHAKACFTHPLEHIQAIGTAPLGVWHPFVFTFLIYLLLLLLRLLIAFVKRVF